MFKSYSGAMPLSNVSAVENQNAKISATTGAVVSAEINRYQFKSLNNKTLTKYQLNLYQLIIITLNLFYIQNI